MTVITAQTFGVMMLILSNPILPTSVASLGVCVLRLLSSVYDLATEDLSFTADCRNDNRLIKI